MPEDSFTEVTSQSWFSRLGNSIKGILFGLILFVVAFPVLFLNEGRAVKRHKTLKEGGGLVISVPADTVDPANDAKLVHTTGEAVTDEVLSDAVFGVSANAIKLRRVAEMYQWRESEERSTRKKLGGGTETVTTYNYNKGWHGDLINSSGFRKPEGHANPQSMPYQTENKVAGKVRVGAYTLSSSLISKIDAFRDLPVSDAAGLAPELAGKCKPAAGGFYIGQDPGTPQVGDLRIRFLSVPATQVSLVAKQVADSFEPYHAKAGGSIELLETGIFSAEAMFEQAQQRNKALTWILRGLGFLLMVIGLSAIFKPLSVVADVLPFVGNLVEAGTGFVALLIAAALSTVTIAIAWIFYRPLLGIALLAVAGAILFLLKGKLGKRGAARR